MSNSVISPDIRREWLYNVASRCQIFAADILAVDRGHIGAAFEALRTRLPPPANALESLVLDGMLHRGHANALKHCRRPRESPVQTAVYTSDVLDVKHLLDERYAEPLTYRHIGAALHKDPEWLETRFVAQIGMTMHAYLRRVRLFRAYDLAARSEKIESIPPTVGFRSKPGFFRAFRDVFGKTPHQVTQEYCGVPDAPSTQRRGRRKLRGPSTASGSSSSAHIVR